MSVDVLQDKIRKTKNPSVVVFDAFSELIPPEILSTEGSFCQAYGIYAGKILSALKGVVPAVRFTIGTFALWGADGLSLLCRLLHQAKEKGYYVLLDMPELLSADASEKTARLFTEETCPYTADGILISSYLGTDALQPFLNLCRRGMTVFAVVRTANRTAPEIQDLLTGTRLVHMAAGDIVNRCAQQHMGRCGYSHVGVLASASSGDSLRSLRSKYKGLFLLLDGYDYPNSNAKNCSFAFDKLGHGAAACAGGAILGAWRLLEASSEDYLDAAVQAAERMKKNITRYISVL